VVSLRLTEEQAVEYLKRKGYSPSFLDKMDTASLKELAVRLYAQFGSFLDNEDK